MRVSILKGLPGCRQARGVAVVVDVFRATSTITCLALSQPRSLFIADTVDKSSWGKDAILFSEIPELDADFDNSPLNALVHKFDGNDLTIQSRNGTTAIDAVRHCDSVVLGAFVNADAVVEYLQQLDPPEVSIISIGHIGVPEETEEDNACADYIRDQLIGASGDTWQYRSRLRDRIAVRRSDPLSPQGDPIEEDLALCSMISVFEVVPRAIFYDDGRIEIVPESVPSSLHGDSQFRGRVAMNSLTIERIAEAGRVLGISQAETRPPNVERLLAGHCAELILLSEGRIQKALSYVYAFLNAYTESNTIDWRHEPFLVHILEGVVRQLYSDPQTENEAAAADIEGLTRRTVHAFRECPQNIQSLIALVLGTGGSNYGRLDGRVIPTTQIVYHKRATGEFSINLTNRCPNSCIFCIRDFHTGWVDSGEEQNLYLEREPTQQEILDAVRIELKKWPNGCLIKLCGYGEPVERIEAVIAVIDAIKSASSAFTVQLDTSGWPLMELEDETIFETLKDSGLDIVSVSLNAPNQEMYDRIVRPGCFDYKAEAFENTVASIERARDAGLAVKATFVMIPPIEAVEADCEKLVRKLGVEFVPREYVGRPLPGTHIDDGTSLPMEVKVLDVNRNGIISALQELGAEHTEIGLSKIYHFEIPDNEDAKKEILEVIRSNPPELRQMHPILAIVKEQIEEDSRLIDRLGLLRIIVEGDKTRLVYKEPLQIEASAKREREYELPVDSPENAMMFMNKIGLRLFRFIEKNREGFVLGRARFDVDTWPVLGTYLKVESFDAVDIFAGLRQLGIDPSNASGVHAEELFSARGISLENLTFSDSELAQLGLSRSTTTSDKK